MINGIILHVFRTIYLHVFLYITFELVVTVADERMSKKARAARSFFSAWRKSNEPAADRKAYKTRGAHGWLDPDKDFPFHPRRRGEQTWPRTRAHDLIYTYVHIPKYYKRREKRNGGWTKRNVLASVEADSVPRQRQLGGGGGEGLAKAEISEDGKRDSSPRMQISRDPRGDCF